MGNERCPLGISADTMIAILTAQIDLFRIVMQVIILAGGLGTRISEESHLRPKSYEDAEDSGEALLRVADD